MFCSGVPARADDHSGPLQIVATIFPEYDWVRNVAGEDLSDVQITLLLDKGVDLHSFQPTAEDILKISTCDLFIYVGGESDAWVEDALKGAARPDMTVLKLMDLLRDTVKEEETVEGMQKTGEDSLEGSEPEYDEHIWLSLRNAAVLVEGISQALQDLDKDHAQIYADHAAAYIEKLNALDEKYQAAVTGADISTLLFADRFPFRYLTDDYGLNYYAAFAGCSAETEASFETIAFLSQKIDELGLHAVLTIDGTGHRIAETVISNTQTKDQQILVMDSMQSVAEADVQDGTDYLSIMEKNLEVLKEALQ